MHNRRIFFLTANVNRLIKEASSYFERTRNDEVHIIQNGVKALEMAVKTPPDVIIMDLLIPKLDGVRVFKALKANPSTANIPIIVLSMVPAKKRVLDMGADIFMLEPMESEKLIDTIERLSNPHRSSADYEAYSNEA